MADRRLPRPYTPDELQSLDRALASKPALRAAHVFLLETGLRAHEFASITSAEAASWPRPKWWCRRCRRHRGALRLIGKGGRERVVPLTPAALRAAHSLRLVSENGHLTPWSERGLRWLLQQAGQSVGVHAHPHRARHTYVSRLINSGVPMEVVADLAGHSKMDITRLYTRLDEQTLHRAVGGR